MGETQNSRPKRRRGRVSRAIKKWVKRLIVLVVVLAAGLFGLKAYLKNQAGSSDSDTGYSRALVQRGAMEKTVYGSGTTSASNQPNILAEADGTLTDLRVSVGDSVKEGDILAVLTNEDLDDEITDLEFELWDLDDTILGTASGSAVTEVEAPVAGRVVAIYAEVGDDALAVFRREGALAIISTDGRMKIELNGEDSVLGVALGDKVIVTGEDFTAEGTVVDLTRQGTQATITINDDTLPLGAEVSLATEAGEALGTGTLEVNKPMAVSSYGGTIKSVSVTVGKKVSRRDTLFKLEDSPLTLTIENLRLQREAAAKSLEEAKAKRENLIIIAPCDGTIASLNVSEGDEVTTGMLLGSILQGEDMNLTIAVDELDVISVEQGQKVTITVDALSGVEIEGEVYKIAPVGSNSGGVTTYDVELSFDATGTGVRSGMNATGEITVASKEDTLYVPVEAVMTVNNETYVMVEDGGSQILRSVLSDTGDAGAPQAQEGEADASQEQMPEGEENADNRSGQRGRGASREGMQSAEETGANPITSLISRIRAWLYEGIEESGESVSGTLVKVEIGMQNDDYAEILSGVSEGDVVLYTGSSTSTSTTFSGMTMNMGGGGGGAERGGNGGGMGGGAPGGF